MKVIRRELSLVGMFRARCNLIVRIRFSGLWIQWDIVASEGRHGENPCSFMGLL